MHLNRQTYLSLAVRSAFFAATMTLGWTASNTQAQDSGSETWFGKMTAGGRQFRFAVKLQESEKRWTGKLISLDEGNAEFVLSDVTNDGSQLGFSLKQTQATYEGKVSEGNSDGKWKQRGSDIDLDFERVVEIPRPAIKSLWTGTINVIVQKLDIQIRELESGEIFLDSISQKVGGFIANRSESEGKITLEVPALKASFEGELSDDGTQMIGTWKQGFLSPSLTLTKEKKPDEVLAKSNSPNRPQMPKAPFPYTSTKVTFKNEADGVTLAGTLTVPNETLGSAPAVILVSGSGAQDRDESLAGHKPFWVIADHFSRNGIAVLRFDDRGVGESTGNFATATSVDFARDVQAGVNFLKAHPKVAEDQVGICGHSEGGLIAPMVAADDKEIAFIILMAGLGVNGEKIVTSQGALILKASGMDDETIEREGKVQQALIDLAKVKPPLSNEDFRKQAKELLEDFTGGAKPEQVDALVAGAVSQLRTPWFEYFMAYEPSTNLEKVTCPVLAINGEKDLQVEPNLNLAAIKAALEKAPTEEFKLIEIPNLNHLFQNCQTGLLQEYSEIEETFDANTLTLMSEWIQGVVQ